ncbi:MAG TPA: hypothetical protein DCL44_03510 [Elusimicrobia bacterium]|nr:hypothetical protein [Elusimicrobiota bacterium]
MTMAKKIRAVTSTCLVVVCMITLNNIEGFSNLKLTYRILIDVIVFWSALQLADWIARFINRGQRRMALT